MRAILLVPTLLDGGVSITVERLIGLMNRHGSIAKSWRTECCGESEECRLR